MFKYLFYLSELEPRFERIVAIRTKKLIIEEVGE